MTTTGKDIFIMVWILLELAENQQTVKLFNEPLKLYNKLYCIWPSDMPTPPSIFFCLSKSKIIGKEMGYILGRLPVWCTFTPMANLESPTNLTIMFLQYGGKNHREPIQIRRECADLTKKGPSLDLKTTVWRHGVNCITMSPYINPIGKFVTNHCCKKKQKNNLPDNKVLARFKSDWNSFINYDEKICKRSLLLIIWLMRLIILKIITVPKDGSLFSPLIATFFFLLSVPTAQRLTLHSISSSLLIPHQSICQSPISTPLTHDHKIPKLLHLG